METKKIKTVRRDWIKNQIKKGNLEVKTEMILTDDYAWDDEVKFQKTDWRPAVIDEFTEHDFITQTGRAYWQDDNTICWVICSGTYYSLRLKNNE